MNMTKEAFELRGEFIQAQIEQKGVEKGTEDVTFLLSDPFSRGLINAMCQLMADSGCRAGETPASQSKTHKCLANMQEHRLEDCPSLQGFKVIEMKGGKI